MFNGQYSDERLVCDTMSFIKPGTGGPCGRGRLSPDCGLSRTGGSLGTREGTQGVHWDSGGVSGDTWGTLRDPPGRSGRFKELGWVLMGLPLE